MPWYQIGVGIHAKGAGRMNLEDRKTDRGERQCGTPTPQGRLPPTEGEIGWSSPD